MNEAVAVVVAKALQVQTEQPMGALAETVETEALANNGLLHLGLFTLVAVVVAVVELEQQQELVDLAAEVLGLFLVLVITALQTLAVVVVELESQVH
jgi:hypothetical protein